MADADKKLNDLSEEHLRIIKTIKRLEQSIAGLSNTCETNFEDLNIRLDRVEDRFDQLDSNFTYQH